MKATEALTCLAKLSPWLQGLWVIWLVCGIVLLLISWNICSKSLAHASGPQETTTEGAALPEAPSKVEESLIDEEGWSVIPAKGKDEGGRMASFEINVLSREFNWKYESSTVVELNGKPEDMIKHFSSPGLQYRFGRSLAIIVVGAASEEGRREYEEDRARDRAKQLAVWIVETLQAPSTVYKLNLGHYKPSCRPSVSPENTASQRSIVVVGILKQDEGVNLEEALRSAWVTKPGLPFKLENYSKFELVPHD